MGGYGNYYRHVLMVALPIMIQQGITNFVNLLDNIMVGRIGTDAMSGVAIDNQLIFVWNLCIFGGLSGIAIFTAQFYGKGDTEGIRDAFRLKIMLAAILTAIGLAVFLIFDRNLIALYLHEDGGVGNAAATMAAAGSYMKVICWGFLPFAISNAYSSTLRASGETVVPMQGGLIAVAVNLIGNYILIYGKFGAPALGVVGAALATCISRFVELIFVAVRTHSAPEKYPFIKGAYRSFAVPKALILNCAAKGTPLLVNEALWSASQAVLTRTYSLRGLSVVAALNISMTVSNVFNVAFIAMGSAIGIVIGQELGQGKTDTVKSNANRLCVFSVLLCLVSGGVLFACAGLFPRIYNTSDDIRVLAAGFLRISAACMPIYAYINASYFIMRSGGSTVITFIFDSGFCWLVTIPAVYFLEKYTGFGILAIFLIVQLIDLIKCAIGFFLIQKGVWIRNLTELAKA